MKIVMVTLNRVTFKVDDDLHTIAYARDIKNWMSQWTVVNNFNPICTAVSESMDFLPTERLAAIKKAAISKFIAVHIERVKTLFPEHTKVDRDYSTDFGFNFSVFIADSGEMLEPATIGQA
jgi:hypothetical protein